MSVALPVCLLGDACDHGGVITGPVSFVLSCEAGRGVARTGDTLTCAQHGPQLLTGTAWLQVDGRKAVRIGDKAACGATMITGSLILGSD